MSHRTQTAQMQQAPKAIDRACRAGHRAIRSVAVAAALTAQVLPNARGSGDTGLAPCTVTPPACCATLPTEHDRRPMNRQPRGSPASADTCATPRICPARPLPRALATDCACCASLPRPAPCPLPSKHRLNSACLAFWRNCCKEESSGCHLCCACNLVRAHGTNSAGYAKMRVIQGTRADDRGCTADGQIGEHPAGRPRCLPSQCRRPRSRW